MNEKKRPRTASLDPSPETIRRMSEAIRAGWSEKERARRACFKTPQWTPPQIHQDDFRGAGEELAGNN